MRPSPQRLTLGARRTGRRCSAMGGLSAGGPLPREVRPLQLLAPRCRGQRRGLPRWLVPLRPPCVEP
eukprot:8974824-Alexandrium_andersonii.AAC.1